MRLLIILSSLVMAASCAAGERKPVIIEQQPPVEIPEFKPLTKILGKNVAGWIEHLQTHENEAERKLAMMCLADFGPSAEPALPELRKLLKEDLLQPDTRRYAIEALAAIGPAANSTVGDLLAILANAKAPASDRAAACAAVSQIQPDSPQVRKAILSAMRDGSQEVRLAAIAGTVLLPPGDKSVLNALSSALSNENEASGAAFSLLCLGDDGIAVLNGALERGGNTAKVAAARALSHAGGDAASALAAIMKAIKRERDAAIRRELAISAVLISPAHPAVLEMLAERIAAGERPLKDAPAEAPKEKTTPPAGYELETRILGSAGETALPALRNILRSRDAGIRKHAVGMLAKIDEPPVEAIDDLVARAQDRDLEVRTAAIRALDGLGPSAAKAKDALLDIARQDDALQRQAQLAALNVSRDPQKPRLRSLLDARPDTEVFAALKDPNPIVRVEAAEALRARQEDAASVAGALIEALKDEDERVRVAAATSLVRFGKYSRVAIATFIDWLEQHNQAPAGAPNPAPFPAALDREGLAVPKAALAALAGMGADAKPALPAIVQTAISPISDRDRELQKRIGLVLRIIGPDAVPSLVAELKNAEPKIRARAARAISAMEVVGALAIPDLIELSKSAVDSDAQAGLSALQAMGPIAYPLAGRFLVEVLLTDLFAERRKWAAYALGDIRVPETGDTNKVVDGLQSALLDPDESVCRAAHGALVRIGEPALPRLRELLKLEEGQASYWWAVRAMARMKADPADVIPRLVEVMQPGVRQVKEGAFAERGTAAELLGEYAPGHPEIIPVLLRTLGDREDYVARAAMRSLARFGNKAIDPLQRLLRHRSPLLRQRAVEALNTLQSSSDIELE